MLLNQATPDRVAVIVDGGPTLTYGALDRAVASTAERLVARQLVFLVGDNDLPTLLTYLACLRVGAVPLLLGAGLQASQLAGLVAAYDPDQLVVPRAMLQALGLADSENPGSLEKLENSAGTTATGTATAGEGHSEGDYVWFERRVGPTDNPLATATQSILATRSILTTRSMFPGAASAVADLHPDLGLLLTTSGSTGSPKLVRLTQSNVVSNARSIANYLGLGPSDRAITSLPLNYSFGLSIVNSHLVAGGSLVLTRRSLMDPQFWALMSHHAVTSLSGVPYSFDILLKLRLARLKMPAVRTLTQAGGRLDPTKLAQVQSVCEEKGWRFFPMYGQTEATARIAYLAPEDVARKLGSIGRAIPDGELWLEDAQGLRITAPDTAGELIYSGPNVSLGYAESRADLALGDVNQGRLRTGDIARFDADGYFYIEGRLRRFLKVFGVRVALDAVEARIAALGYTGVAHGRDDQLELHLEGLAADAAEPLRQDFAVWLGLHPSALRVQVWADLPRLSSGKVNYSCLTTSP